MIKYYLLITILFFSNCSPQSDKGTVISNYDGNHVKKQIFDTAGNLKSEQIFLKNGEELLPDGYIKFFRPDGTVKALGFYKKGKKDSIALNYNERGIITGKLYVADGLLIGSQYTYYDNGKVKSYKFYSKPDVATFYLRFDSSGHLETNDGSPLSRYKFDEETVYTRDDTAHIEYLAATPENLRIEVWWSAISHGKPAKWLKLSHLRPSEIANIYAFKDPLYGCIEGPAECLTVLNMYDTTTNKLLVSDTDRYQIKVKM
jgi:hypothetical protein